MSKSALVALIVTVILTLTVVLATFIHNQHQKNMQHDDYYKPKANITTIKTITSVEELNSVLSNENLIMHFDVDWSIQAVASRSTIIKFKEAIVNDERYRDVAFYRVDCTKQEGQIWDALEKWLHEQNADQSLMFTGCGAIAWVKSGKIVDLVHYAALEGSDKMMERTRKSMLFSE